MNRFTLAVFSVFMSLSAVAETKSVDGIPWTFWCTFYTSNSSQDYITIGSKDSSSTAVPVTTSGAIAMPAEFADVNLNVGHDVPVTSIADGAFSGCSKLTSVTIPSSVKNIGASAFSGCGNLKSILFAGNAPAGSVASSSFSGTASDCVIKVRNGSTGWGVSIPGTWRGRRIEYMSSVEQASLIVKWTINDSRVLTGVSLYGVSTVEIPDGVTGIGAATFRNCSGLVSVTIPESVASIGSSAFFGCSSLSVITMVGNAPSIGSSCFSGVASGCVVKVNRGSTGWGVTIPGKWNGLRIEYFCKHDGTTSIVNEREATCTEAGYTGDRICDICDEVLERGATIPALGHKMGAGVVTKEPTVSEAGVMSYYCTRCGILLKTESISTLDALQLLSDCLGGLPYGSVTLGSDEVQWRRDSEPTHNGKGSLRLMGNGNDSESSIRFAVNSPGQLSFWWKVSSEYDAEDDSVYDYAYLTVDGAAQGGLTDDSKLFGHAIGGNMDWTNVVIDINGAGNHTIAWTYKKDEVDEISGFDDCVWLENVVWRPMVSAAFALGGGAGSVPDSVIALSGTTITIPSSEGLSREGHIFAGWSDGAELHAAGDSYVLGNSNVVFTATWIRKTFLTFALGGGTGALPTAIHEVPGSVVSLPDANGIKRDGYEFAGWSDGAKTYAAGESYTIGSSDVVFTATWTRKSILTFALNGGAGVVPAAIKVVPDAVVALPVASGFSKPKHVFAGWSDGSKTYAENANYTVTDSDVEFTAQWTAKTISLPTIQSPNVVNGGVVTDAASVTLTLATGEGATLHYTLDGSIPTAESPIYAGPIELTDYAVTIKVIATRDDYFDSEVAEFSFARKPYTLAECLGLDGASDAVITVGGDGEAWHRVLGDESHDGTAGLRSGALTHNQTNWVQVCVNGAGILSFWWKASSEMVRGKVRDGASFFVDGDLQAGPIGGADGDWVYVLYEVAEDGPHTFRWEFGKSATDSADIGEDCAWLDEIVWGHGEIQTITYENLRGAANPNPLRYCEGRQVLFASLKPIAGYGFSGWSPSEITPDMRGPLRVYANWTANRYSIVYNANGGSGSMPATEAEYDVPVTISESTFSRAGFEMIGWATNATSSVVYIAGQVVTNLTAQQNGQVSLFAVWGKSPVFEIVDGELVGVTLNNNEVINIPYGVTSIGRYAFEDCTGLRSVTIPDSVTNIEDFAFIRCSDLTNVTISGSVKKIGRRVFRSCNSLTSVIIENGVPEIGEMMFEDCSHLTNIVMPDSVMNIRANAFNGCSGLTSVTIPNSVTSIEGNAFLGCSELTSVTIPNSVTSIGASAFYGCNGLTSVTIPQCVCTNKLSNIFSGGAYTNIAEVIVMDGVTSIGASAFSGCSGLTSVTIPDSVTSIGASAFSSCSGLTSVTIPNSVTSIGNYAFSGCRGLTSVTIPDSVTNIGQYAFNGCSGLTSVTIPDSVTSIGASAFYGCNGLTSVTIPQCVCTNQLSNIFSEGAYTNIAEVIVMDGVTSIGGYAFSGCSGLTSVTIPDSVTNIGQYAFNGCSGLTSVTIPDSATSIGSGAFSGCRSLKNIVLPFVGSCRGNTGTPESMFGYIFGTSAGDGLTKVVQYCTSSATITRYIPASLTSVKITGETVVGYRAFWNCNMIKKVHIPRTLKKFGTQAFKYCDKLEEVDIESIAAWCGITSDSAAGNPLCFARTLKLNGKKVVDLVIPEGVKSIGKYAFRNDNGGNYYKTISFPASLQQLDEAAFYGSSSLTNMVFHGNAPTVGASCFSGVPSACIVGVLRKSTGWDVVIPGTWNGMRIEFLDQIPEVDASATASVVTNAIDAAGFADATVKAAIGGSAAEYNAFRTWAGSVKGSGGGSAAAGEAAVVASPHAAAAFFLGAERLFVNEPTVEIEEVAIGNGKSGTSETEKRGTMIVAVAVKDGETAVAVNPEKVAAMFEATGDLGDWNGAAKLTPEVMVEEGDGATMRFKVTPGDGTAPRAFLRICK